jgi:hypothetical protein
MGLKEAGWCEKIFLKLKRSNGYYSIIISIYKNLSTPSTKGCHPSRGYVVNLREERKNFNRIKK